MPQACRHYHCRCRNYCRRCIGPCHHCCRHLVNAISARACGPVAIATTAAAAATAAISLLDLRCGLRLWRGFLPDTHVHRILSVLIDMLTNASPNCPCMLLCAHSCARAYCWRSRSARAACRLTHRPARTSATAAICCRQRDLPYRLSIRIYLRSGMMLYAITELYIQYVLIGVSIVTLGGMRTHQRLRQIVIVGGVHHTPTVDQDIFGVCYTPYSAVVR